jgi:hypothetical protein
MAQSSVGQRRLTDGIRNEHVLRRQERVTGTTRPLNGLVHSEAVHSLLELLLSLDDEKHAARDRCVTTSNESHQITEMIHSHRVSMEADVGLEIVSTDCGHVRFPNGTSKNNE